MTRREFGPPLPSFWREKKIPQEIQEKKKASGFPFYSFIFLLSFFLLYPQNMCRRRSARTRATEVIVMVIREQFSVDEKETHLGFPHPNSLFSPHRVHKKKSVFSARLSPYSLFLPFLLFFFIFDSLGEVFFLFSLSFLLFTLIRSASRSKNVGHFTNTKEAFFYIDSFTRWEWLPSRKKPSRLSPSVTFFSFFLQGAQHVSYLREDLMLADIQSSPS